ncbi:unnamed protein product [Vicia faba]|uniref:Uncharacterized protein n=1 Tax=Vicia faba TaxID=3906 RepID=A0AAV0ZZA0_VICFA|nr:unnamed protein product [Vicia faba]
MYKYLNITIHHSGEFVTKDKSVYEGGALEIDDLYRVHLSVEVFIQHTLSKSNYADETEVVLDEVSLNVIIDEAVVALEEMLNETDVREDGVRVAYLKSFAKSAQTASQKLQKGVWRNNTWDWSLWLDRSNLSEEGLREWEELLLLLIGIKPKEEVGRTLLCGGKVGMVTQSSTVIRF